MNYLLNDLLVATFKHESYGIKSGKSVIEMTETIEKELEDYEYLKQSNEELQKLNTNYGKRIDKLEEILEILKRFIKSGESDLFGWCEQFDDVNNTNISRLIEEWLER